MKVTDIQEKHNRLFLIVTDIQEKHYRSPLIVTGRQVKRNRPHLIVAERPIKCYRLNLIVADIQVKRYRPHLMVTDRQVKRYRLHMKVTDIQEKRSAPDCNEQTSKALSSTPAARPTLVLFVGVPSNTRYLGGRKENECQLLRTLPWGWCSLPPPPLYHRAF
jgi:hypothetical protein